MESENLPVMTKLIAVPVLFALFVAGRFSNLHFVRGEDLLSAFQWGVLYGLWFAMVAWFVADLVFARGLLQIKILSVKILFAFVTALLLVNRFLDPHPFLFEAIASAVLYIILLSIDSRAGKKANFTINRSHDLPVKYTRPHPLKSLLEMIFRLFPNPESIGLYKVGNPDKNSSVIATGNYELTIRRVVKSLSSLDCWLLVCDSRGINMWCSSLANHFGTDKIVGAVKSLGLEDMVEGRTILLPQLCAANVSLKELKQSTGFKGVFGPVRISDLEKYLADRKSPGIREITFNWKERLEMAGGTIIFPVLFALLIFNFIDPMKILVILPALYALSFLHSLLFPYRIVRNIMAWSLLYPAVLFGIFFLIFKVFLGMDVLIYTVSICIGMFYLINEFEGWSPLVKFSMTSSYKKPKIAIDEELCTGCGTCMDVCPRGVYRLSEGKSKIISLSSCISCKSCLTQCPAGAIDHSAKNINEALA